jgi:hypothetical protein
MEDVEFSDVASEKSRVSEEKKVQSQNDCSQTEPEQYLCLNCGSENVIANESLYYFEEINGICACRCGHGEDGVAAEQKELIHGSEWQTGRLDAEGEIEWDKSGDDVMHTDVTECNIYCQECFDESGWEEWEYGEFERDEDSYMLEVYCRNCEHESDYSKSLFE